MRQGLKAKAKQKAPTKAPQAELSVKDKPKAKQAQAAAEHKAEKAFIVRAGAANFNEQSNQPNIV